MRQFPMQQKSFESVKKKSPLLRADYYLSGVNVWLKIRCVAKFETLTCGYWYVKWHITDHPLLLQDIMPRVGRFLKVKIPRRFSVCSSTRQNFQNFFPHVKAFSVIFNTLSYTLLAVSAVKLKVGLNQSTKCSVNVKVYHSS